MSPVFMVILRERIEQCLLRAERELPLSEYVCFVCTEGNLQSLQSGRLALFPQCLQPSFVCTEDNLQTLRSGGYPSLCNVCNPPLSPQRAICKHCGQEAGPLSAMLELQCLQILPFLLSFLSCKVCKPCRTP